MAFITLSVSQLFHSFNLRNDHLSLFKIGLFSNRFLVWSVVAGLAIQISLVHIPFFNEVFGIRALTWQCWLFVIGLSFIPVVVNAILEARHRVFWSIDVY